MPHIPQHTTTRCHRQSQSNALYENISPYRPTVTQCQINATSHHIRTDGATDNRDQILHITSYHILLWHPNNLLPHEQVCKHPSKEEGDPHFSLQNLKERKECNDLSRIINISHTQIVTIWLPSFTGGKLSWHETVES